MSDARHSPLTPEDDILAAELALRVLGESELDQARARQVADPAFAQAVEAWDARLMPWLDAIVPVQPDPSLWPRILAVIIPQDASTNVVVMRRRFFSWRDAAFALSGIAASLLVAVGFRVTDRARPPAVTAARASDLAVAVVTPEGAGTAVAVVSYDRVGASLIVTPAALTALPGRSYELWVVPVSGTPKSLGVLEGSTTRKIVLAEDLAASFAGAPTIAISTEQRGGSRTGLPVGPIIATGKLTRI